MAPRWEFWWHTFPPHLTSFHFHLSLLLPICPPFTFPSVLFSPLPFYSTRQHFNNTYVIARIHRRWLLFSIRWIVSLSAVFMQILKKKQKSRKPIPLCFIIIIIAMFLSFLHNCNPFNFTIFQCYIYNSWHVNFNS